MELYCPSCGTERQVIETVAWQPDMCAGCGRALQDDTPT